MERMIVSEQSKANLTMKISLEKMFLNNLLWKMALVLLRLKFKTKISLLQVGEI